MPQRITTGHRHTDRRQHSISRTTNIPNINRLGRHLPRIPATLRTNKSFGTKRRNNVTAKVTGELASHILRRQVIRANISVASSHA
ncbi:MAG TPA: hypothetical protein QF564_33885 [Pirellulaceae bacterium]|jgi:uncharacterized protein YaaW (UPF0174 family)|nr:hypothetical protein [Pirellulaceae bacterium]